jgi:hypothetical protein
LIIQPFVLFFSKASAPKQLKIVTNTMSVPSTPVKLAGLVFAMGLFGMGPGTILLDELKAKWEKKRNDHSEEEKVAAIVAPPGEEPTSKKKTQHHNPHLLEGTSNNNNPSPIVRKHPTEMLSQEAAHDFVKHPFLPVTAPANKQDKPASDSNTATIPMSTTIPWLSFMLGTSTENTSGEKK